MPVQIESAEYESRVVREEFLAAGTASFRELISKDECLITHHLNPEFLYSAVSLSRLSNAKIWIDNRVICVYDDEYGIYDELSLYNDSFDFSRVSQTPIEPIDDEVVLFPHLDPHNYYHWLIDTLPCFGVLELAGINLSAINHLYIHRCGTSFQARHLEQLGVNPNKVRSYGNRVRHFSVKELIIPFFRLDKGWPNPWAVEYLKTQWLPGYHLNSGVANIEFNSGNRIYVARGNARRQVTNEAELIKRLSEEGYIIVEPHELTIEEQAAHFYQADYVLGPHGAGLANLAFCRPGVRVMEFAGHYITSHFRIVSTLSQLQYRAIAAGMDEESGRLVPNNTNNKGIVRDADFIADIEHIVAEAGKYFTA